MVGGSKTADHNSANRIGQRDQDATEYHTYKKQSNFAEKLLKGPKGPCVAGLAGESWNGVILACVFVGCSP